MYLCVRSRVRAFARSFVRQSSSSSFAPARVGRRCAQRARARVAESTECAASSVRVDAPHISFANPTASRPPVARRTDVDASSSCRGAKDCRRRRQFARAHPASRTLIARAIDMAIVARAMDELVARASERRAPLASRATTRTSTVRQLHIHRWRATSRATRAARDDPSSSRETTEDDVVDGGDPGRDAVRALLPSFLAMRRGSRFAHQEFVRRCASARRAHGVSVADARIESALMGLSSSMRMGTSEQDAFASAVAMVTLTLRRFDGEATGEETDGEDAADAVDRTSDAEEKEDPEEKGMMKYIEMTNKNADEGHTLRRMELERRFLGGTTRRPTPGEAIMRMNCKLTLLTREMIEDERGITHARRELEGMEDVAASADETEIIEIETRQQLALAWCTRERTPARAHASDMLVAFVSVLTGHPVGYTEFVRAARSAYEAGISGDELTAALDAPEFDVEGVQRGMFGRASDAPRIFAGFITTAYVAFEALGLALPAAARGDKELFAYASHPRASDEVETASTTTDDKRRARVRGLRDAVETWMEMDKEELANEVNASLSIDEEEEEDDAQPRGVDLDAPPSQAASVMSTVSSSDDAFAVVRDDAFGASSITLATLRHQRNIVSFVRNNLATTSA